jgi:hypothetical protein
MPKTKLKVVPIVSTAIPTAAVSAFPINDPLLTPEQAAARLQVPPSTIYELTRARAKRRLPVNPCREVPAFPFVVCGSLAPRRRSRMSLTRPFRGALYLAVRFLSHRHGFLAAFA